MAFGSFGALLATVCREQAACVQTDESIGSMKGCIGDE